MGTSARAGKADVRLVPHSGAAGGSIVLNLTPDARTTLVQDGQGISELQPLQVCGHFSPKD
jgi:hypothetical protein